MAYSRGRRLGLGAWFVSVGDVATTGRMPGEITWSDQDLTYGARPGTPEWASRMFEPSEPPPGYGPDSSLPLSFAGTTQTFFIPGGVPDLGITEDDTRRSVTYADDQVPVFIPTQMPDESREIIAPPSRPITRQPEILIADETGHGPVPDYEVVVDNGWATDEGWEGGGGGGFPRYVSDDIAPAGERPSMSPLALASLFGLGLVFLPRLLPQRRGR